MKCNQIQLSYLWTPVFAQLCFVPFNMYQQHHAYITPPPCGLYRICAQNGYGQHRPCKILLLTLAAPRGVTVLDVLTPLSECRQESVEKMERRISGVSYMCWMDFHNNGILCCGFLCARLISVYFVSLLSLLLSFPAPRQGLPRPIYTARAITPRAITPSPPLHGYHACVCIYIPATTP